MRILLLIMCLASPALAWEASREGAVCLLSHTSEEGSVRVSHDPQRPMPYAIQLSRAQASWAGNPIFAIRFEGPRALTITTDRHQLSEGGAALSVMDRGFENVLRGIERNDTAFAVLGDQTLVFSLEGAAPEVARFRSCASGVGV